MRMESDIPKSQAVTFSQLFSHCLFTMARQQAQLDVVFAVTMKLLSHQQQQAQLDVVFAVTMKLLARQDVLSAARQQWRTYVLNEMVNHPASKS